MSASSIRLQRPGHEELARVVVDDLKHRQSRGLGSHQIYAQIALPQLEECAQLQGKPLNGSQFVSIYLTKLWLAADAS